MEFFRTTPTVDWLGKKWYLIAFCFLLSGAGLVSLLARGGPRYGIDFRGGTLVHLQFQQTPPLDRLRAALGSQGLGDSTLQRFGPEANNEILIGLGIEALNEQDLSAGRNAIVNALSRDFAAGDFEIRNVEIVGPKVGAALRRQALNATLLALASMMLYIAFRFEWIYGIAAVLANFMGVVITIGILSLTDIEISLTLIAALLTLVGYSINDTVVIFDRIRENARLMRRERFTVVVNDSVNQTLSRTVLTGGLTWVSVVILYFLGGEVLQGFAFTLVVGIPIGTLSSVAIGSTLVTSWQEYTQRDRRGGGAARAAREPARPKRDKVRVGAKA